LPALGSISGQAIELRDGGVLFLSLSAAVPTKYVWNFHRLGALARSVMLAYTLLIMYFQKGVGEYPLKKGDFEGASYVQTDSINPRFAHYNYNADLSRLG
jgi:hypothetical protein